MSARSWSGVAGLVLVGLAACASGGATAATNRVDPPRMTSSNAPPNLVVPSMPMSGRSPVRVTLEVMIDETGRPDMSTLKVTGFGAAENEQALRSWIEQAAFRPAHRGDTPVPGLYQTHLEVRVEVHRIS